MAGAAVSLVEAIKQKYDSDGSNEISNIKYLKEAALSHKPGDFVGRGREEGAGKGRWELQLAEG